MGIREIEENVNRYLFRANLRNRRKVSDPDLVRIFLWTPDPKMDRSINPGLHLHNISLILRIAETANLRLNPQYPLMEEIISACRENMIRDLINILMLWTWDRTQNLIGKWF